MPTLTVIAGPNGSGKTTLMRSVDFEGRERLLDPDTIARGLNPLKPSAAAIAAGREVLKRTADYLNRRVSFAVETTLPSRGRVDLIRKAKSQGSEIHMLFIGMNSPDRCITRIRNRAARGGHFIPDADVRRRYARSVANAARWQRASALGQKTAVEGQELGDIDDRIAGEAGRARRREDITWDIGKFQVAGDHGHDCGLNAAAVEGVCLDHKRGPPISRLGATRLWEIGPPDLPSLNPRPSLPGVLFEGFQLGAMQCEIHLRGPARIHFIQAFRDRIPLLPVQELRNRRSVQLTSGNPEATGSSFRQAEKIVGYRDGGLHVHSITRVIPDPLTEPYLPRRRRLVEVRPALSSLGRGDSRFENPRRRDPLPVQERQAGFVDAVKTGGRTLEDVEVGHRTMPVNHLANIAVKVGGSLQWDAAEERFTYNEAANAFVKKAVVQTGRA